MTPESCHDVGYQSNTRAKPNSQNLRDLLIQKRKCLSCLQTDHGISTCLTITQEIAQGMHTFHARCAPILASSMSVHPEQHATRSRRANEGMQDTVSNPLINTFDTRVLEAGAEELTKPLEGAIKAGRPPEVDAMVMSGAGVPQGATQDSGADPERPKIQQGNAQQKVQRKQQQERPANR